MNIKKENTMRANLNTLKQAMTLCAKAHRAELMDWSDEGQLGISTNNVPTFVDVTTICQSFFKNSKGMVDNQWGYVAVWLNNKWRAEVDINILNMALPFDWYKQIQD